MNLPNKLTIFRIILVPVFLFFLLCNQLPISMENRRIIAGCVFIIASLTDALDGYIARKYNLITNFGKFMDPLADKILVAAAMIALIGMKDAVVDLPAWVVILIISREFIVTGFRILAIEQNVVISAGFWGKIKTVTQMTMLIFLIFNINSVFLSLISTLLIWLSVIFTVVSAVDYIIKNKEVLN